MRRNAKPSRGDLRAMQKFVNVLYCQLEYGWNCISTGQQPRHLRRDAAAPQELAATIASVCKDLGLTVQDDDKESMLMFIAMVSDRKCFKTSDMMPEFRIRRREAKATMSDYREAYSLLSGIAPARQRAFAHPSV